MILLCLFLCLGINLHVLHTNKGFGDILHVFAYFANAFTIFQIKTCGFHLPTKGGVGGRDIPAVLTVW